MSAGHCDDLGLLDQEVVSAVITRAKELKRTELFQLGEDVAEVAVAALRTHCTTSEREVEWKAW